MSLINQPAEEEGVFIVEEVPENEQDKELSSVFAELGIDSLDDIMLKVYRINEMGKEAHCFDTLPDGLNGIEDRLRDAYGKGDYKIKVFAPTPQGRKSIKKQVKLSIEAPIEKDAPIIDNSSDDLKTVMSGMIEAMNANQVNMLSMLQNSQLESQNKMQEMLITILSNKNDNVEKPPTLLETMGLLKSLQPEQKDPLEVVKSMMDLQGAIKESVEPAEPSAMGELTKGLNSLVSLAANAPAQTAPAPQPGQPGFKPAPNLAPAQMHSMQPTQAPLTNSETTQNGDDMNPLVKMQLANHLKMLLKKAHEGKNPEPYAYLTVEEIPPQFYPLLMENLGENDDEALVNLAKIVPEVMEFSDWFKEFAAEIRAMFAEVAEKVDETGLTDQDETGDHTGKPDNKPDADKSTTGTTEATD